MNAPSDFLAVSEPKLVNRAQQALDSVQGRPDDAARLARELLDDRTATVEERVNASWALGRALSELDQIDNACTSLEQGLKLALDEDLSELAAEIRVSLSVCRLTAGETGEARRLLAEAENDLIDLGSRGRHLTQQGLVDLHLGRLDSAVLHFDQADEHLRPGVDDLARARLLINRGVVHTMSGDLDLAERDLAEAQLLAEDNQQGIMSAGAAQNLGFVAGRKGDVPSALSWFTTARKAYEAAGSPQRVMATLEADLCAVLLGGGLYREAATAARQAATMAAKGGNRLAEAEALLLLARVRLADGTFDDAEQRALEAAALFTQSDRQAWAAMADYVGLQAAAKRSPSPNEALWRRATEITEQLLTSGWVRDSLEVRTFAGRTALGLGRLDEARGQLARAAEARHSGSSIVRANAWLAAATLHLADGDRNGARQSLSTGMDIVEQHRSSLGSTELRAHASINAAELAELGLRLATEDGDADEVFRWAERWHAGGLRLSPVRPDPDSRLAKAMVELRQVHAGAIDGTTDPFEADTDEEVASLEREIQTLSREVETGQAISTRIVEIDELGRHLDGVTLVEFFTIDTELHSVTVANGSATMSLIGDIADVATEIQKIGSALGRLAFGSPNPAMAAATIAALTATAATLDQKLLPVLPGDEAQPVVIVPTGPLQSLAWPALPSLSQRALTVTPSAQLWASARQNNRHRPRSTESRRALLVCGSNLPGGEAEIEQLRALYHDPTVLTGAEATVSTVLTAMENADVVHVAAHGQFRRDNPMFSALELHDGPLTVYDLETLSAAPDTVVLPACDAARSSVHHGDELLGTASALLQVGVQTVIAPITIVPDTSVVPKLMVELHRRMLAGTPPDQALVEARRTVAGMGGQPRHLAAPNPTTASFLSIGTTINGRAPTGRT